MRRRDGVAHASRVAGSGPLPGFRRWLPQAPIIGPLPMLSDSQTQASPQPPAAASPPSSALLRVQDFIVPEAGPRMGLRPLDESTWLVMGADYGQRMARKFADMADPAKCSFAELPGSEAGQREVLAALCAHLEVHHGFSRQGMSMRCADGRLQALDGAPPLSIAGRLVSEDLCLMERDAAGAWRLTAASLCSPSYWRLEDKLGLELLDIHGPVQGLRESIGARMRHFFDGIKTGALFARGNWFLHTSADSFRTPEDVVNLGSQQAGEIAQALRLRCERQTLRRLPHSGAVLFTIRVLLEPLKIVESDAALAAGMLAALQAPGGLAYRAWETPQLHAPLTTYLEEVCCRSR